MKTIKKLFRVEGLRGVPLRMVGVIAVFLIFITGFPVNAAVQPGPSETVKKADKKAVVQKAMKLQMPFVANDGQLAKEVRFYAKTFGGTIYVTQSGEMFYSFPRVEEKAKATDKASSNDKIRGLAIKESLVGADVKSIQSVDPAKTKVNYFIGNDKSKWKTNIATYNSISLGDVYKGINLSLKAYGKTVEKVFTVQPGADPKTIKLKMEGAKSIRINDKGELVLETDLGEILFSKPIAYQEKNGKRENVQVAYYVDKGTYGFTSGQYDRSRPLVIDPTLSYVTYLGGASDDGSRSIAVDGLGNVYITGVTSSSSDFPLKAAFEATYQGDPYDVFVAKFDPSRIGDASLIYCTYLGGSTHDEGYDIAVDGIGSAYITGMTDSIDFPTTAGAYQTNKTTPSVNNDDAFLTKLGPGGALSYSTYLGDDAWEHGFGIFVDTSFNAYVTGRTSSINFPTTAEAYQTVWGGGADVFVTIFNNTGTALLYSTFLGGNNTDFGFDVTADSTGNVYITGTTRSDNFPTPGAYQDTFQGGSSGGPKDAFVAKFDATLSGLIYSTYLGGAEGEDDWPSIAVDTLGYAYVTGGTASTTFPTTPGAFQETCIVGGSFYDAFITKLNPSGSGLVYSTCLGGSSFDYGRNIAIDSYGNAYVVGTTQSNDFPTRYAIYSDLTGSINAFITALSADGSVIGFSSYLGVSNTYGHGALDIVSNFIYVTGSIDATGLSPTPNAFQSTYAGGRDAFLVEITPDLDADGDLIPDVYDNCPTVSNSNQANNDGDSRGNACETCDNDPNKFSPGICGCGVPDTDADSDSVIYCLDNCPNDYNQMVPYNLSDSINDCATSMVPPIGEGDLWQPDYDCDELGDVCDEDDDNDGLYDVDEADIGTDPHNDDSDGDGVLDGDDAFPMDDTEWADFDGDGLGDNLADNCPRDYNQMVPYNLGDSINDCATSMVPPIGEGDPWQPDYDCDSGGNACDSDADNDTYISAYYPDGNDCNDLDPAVYPGVGDCEGISAAPKNPKNDEPDADEDGVNDAEDNCPSVANGPDNPGDPPDNQTNSDPDEYGDACDTCPLVDNPDQNIPVWYKDTDGDGYSDGQTATACGQPFGYIAVSSGFDCNDDEPAINPGAVELSNNDVDENCDGEIVWDDPYKITLEMVGTDYNDWMPVPDQEVTVNFKVMGPGDVEVTGVDFSFDQDPVISHTGKYNNDNSDSGPDFDPAVFNGNQVVLTSHDYGGSITIHVTATFTADGTLVVRHKDFRFPKDTDRDGIPDKWEQDNNLNPLVPDSELDPDGDGSTNFEEYRGFMWGGLVVKVPEPNNVYQTAAYIPDNVVKHIRTRPDHRDLFVKYVGFDAAHPFAIGAAYINKDIDVYALNETEAASLNDTFNIDVVTVNLSGATFGLETGHIIKRGVRDFTFATLGLSSFGGIDSYGSNCNIYRQAIDNYFVDSPYIDGATLIGDNMRAPGDWSESGNGSLDLITRVEDKNDNGDLDGGENKLSNTPPALDGDHIARAEPGSPDPWEFGHTLSPFNVDSDDNPILVELPVADITHEYTKAQVLKHVITHEIGHNVGITIHTEDPTCVMYNQSNNWDRDGNFSEAAEQLIRIHNN